MAEQLYSFDPTKGETQESLKRRREIAQAMMEAGMAPARNIGEGLTSFGNSVFGALRGNAADNEAAKNRQMVADALSHLPAGADFTDPNIQKILPFADDSQQLVLSAMMDRAEKDRARSQENEDWKSHFDISNAADMEKLSRTQAFQAQQNALNRKATLDAATKRANASGKYYAVNTGSGIVLIDKGTGMGYRMGVDSNGQLTQIGRPFTPSIDAAGQISEATAPAPAPATTAPAAAPAVAPQDVPPTGRSVVENPNGVSTRLPVPNANPAAPAAQPQMVAPDVAPLLPPSVDPRAQGAVAEAKAKGIVTGKYEANRPIMYKKAKAAIADYEAKDKIVDKSLEDAMAMMADPVKDPRGNVVDWKFNPEKADRVSGKYGFAMQSLPNTDAYNFVKKLETAKANIGFDALQNMRQNSPTGGALGAISDFENRQLQATTGNMDVGQGGKQLFDTIRSVREYRKGVRQRLGSAFNNDYGDMGTKPMTGTVLGGDNGPEDGLSDDDLIKMYGGD